MYRVPENKIVQYKVASQLFLLRMLFRLLRKRISIFLTNLFWGITLGLLLMRNREEVVFAYVGHCPKGPEENRK